MRHKPAFIFIFFEFFEKIKASMKPATVAH